MYKMVDNGKETYENNDRKEQNKRFLRSDLALKVVMVQKTDE